MTLDEYMLEVFRKTDNIIKITTIEGKQLSRLSPIPGWGGFGNLRGSDSFLIDGKKARFANSDRSSAIGYREFEFV